MRYFDRLLNFFTSSYLNNTRFHHSTLGYLRIFFERNNKLKSTFSSLGNVFRNSKWSDLKAQNIKTSFVKSWSTYFMTITIVSLIILPFFGTYYGGFITSNIPFIGEIYEIFCFTWTHCEDLTKALTVIIFSTWSYLKATLLSKVSHRYDHVYDSLVTTNTRMTTQQQSSPSVKLADNGVVDVAPIEMMYHLAYTTKNINNLKQNTNVLALITKPSLASYVIDDYSYDSLNPLSSYTSTQLTISDLEHSFTVVPKTNFSIQQIDVNSASLNNVSSYNVALSLTGLNTQEALKTSKEDRWLLRNSLLSESIIINSNSFTQSKKLLGVNFLGSDSSTKNVWNSTKLNSLTSEGSSSFISNLQELFSQKSLNGDVLSHNSQSSTDTTNFNFFENSRMWLTKKYFFTNQLKNNNKSLTTSNTLNKVEPNLLTNTHLLETLSNLQQQNPNVQLQNLSFYITPSKTIVNVPNTLPSYDMYISNGDLDILKLSNLSFLNKLTYTTSNGNLNYFTTLPYTTSNLTNVLSFKK